MPKVEIIPAPGLIQNVPEGKTAVLIDVVRFTSSMITALCNGAKCVETFDNIQTPLELKKQGWLAAGEREGIKIDGYDYSNSPLDFSSANVAGKKIAFTTTNGTYTRSRLTGYENIYAGGFVNISAVEQRLLNENQDVVLVCSGRKRQTAIEDTLFAAFLAKRLVEKGNFTYFSDNVVSSLLLCSMAENDIKQFAVDKSPFLKHAYSSFIGKDIDFVFTNDIFNFVPEEISPCRFVIKNERKSSGGLVGRR